MNKKGIAFQLGVYVLAAVIVVISLIVLLNYKHSRKIIMQNIEESAIHQSGTITNQIAANIINSQEVVRNVASQALYYHSRGDLAFFLQQVVKANKVINGLHIRLFEKADTITFTAVQDQAGNMSSPHDYQICSLLQNPDIANECVRQGKGLWSKPFYCPPDSSMLMISYFLPVKNQQGNIVGVISGDLGLGFLSEILFKIRIHDTGFAFIVGEDGTYLIHPKKEWVMLRNIFSLPDKIFAGDKDSIREQFISGKPGSGFANPELLGYEKSWFYFASIPHTNWHIVLVIPADELFHDLRVIFREILIVAISGILLIFLIIVLIFNRMFSPLREVVRSIQRFSFGERKKSEKNEVELLNESLKELQFQYGTYVKEQDQVRKARRKYEKDLKSAKEIQRTIVPQGYELLKNRQEIDLHAVLQPAESIGGDLYDYFFIDDSHILIAMGDVSGKGIPAALFMAVAHTLIKSNSNVLSARHIVEVVNKAMSKENLNQHFLTLFLGVLDIQTGILDYCNAAHNYPFLVRKSTIIPLEQTHGLPIGLYANKPYKADSIVLSKNDLLILYTDGVTDCKNEQSEFYGIGRLTDFISGLGGLSPHELVDELMNDLMAFKGSAVQADDISLMVLRFKGKFN